MVSPETPRVQQAIDDAGAREFPAPARLAGRASLAGLTADAISCVTRFLWGHELLVFATVSHAVRRTIAAHEPNGEVLRASAAWANAGEGAEDDALEQMVRADAARFGRTAVDKPSRDRAETDGHEVFGELLEALAAEGDSDTGFWEDEGDEGDEEGEEGEEGDACCNYDGANEANNDGNNDVNDNDNDNDEVNDGVTDDEGHRADDALLRRVCGIAARVQAIEAAMVSRVEDADAFLASCLHEAVASRSRGQLAQDRANLARLRQDELPEWIVPVLDRLEAGLSLRSTMIELLRALAGSEDEAGSDDGDADARAAAAFEILTRAGAIFRVLSASRPDAAAVPVAIELKDMTSMECAKVRSALDAIRRRGGAEPPGSKALAQIESELARIDPRTPAEFAPLLDGLLDAVEQRDMDTLSDIIHSLRLLRPLVDQLKWKLSGKSPQERAQLRDAIEEMKRGPWGPDRRFVLGLMVGVVDGGPLVNDQHHLVLACSDLVGQLLRTWLEGRPIAWESSGPLMRNLEGIFDGMALANMDPQRELALEVTGQMAEMRDSEREALRQALHQSGQRYEPQVLRPCLDRIRNTFRTESWTVPPLRGPLDRSDSASSAERLLRVLAARGTPLRKKMGDACAIIGAADERFDPSHVEPPIARMSARERGELLEAVEEIRGDEPPELLQGWLDRIRQSTSSAAVAGSAVGPS
ncbi:MAG TPA: hypothetical protein VHA82_05130 [Ramlibacter sp.]|nr:hypothetical protein [Ramlibacter sp.]